jgi:PAS domain S-box-containing protein
MTEGEGRQPDGARFDEAPLHDAEFHEGGEHAAELLRAIVRISPLSMVLTDPNQPDYPMVFCNRAFTRLTGYTEEEVTGRNCRFLQGPDTDPAAGRVLGDAVRAGAETQVDLWNYRKDGSRFWNSMFIGPVHDAQGKLLYYFGSQVDSSARRAAEEAANRERRLDTLGAMAAGLAHEINNLMTVVVGNAEGLKKAIEGDAALERLRRIEWASLSAGKLTRQLLAFAGRQGLQAERTRLMIASSNCPGSTTARSGSATCLGPLPWLSLRCTPSRFWRWSIPGNWSLRSSTWCATPRMRRRRAAGSWWRPVCSTMMTWRRPRSR